jgi:predicted nucleic acid-binding protein
MSSLPSQLVVDAWPMMEWIQGKEPAAAAFDSILAAAVRGEVKLLMCWINQGEVAYLIRKNFLGERASVAVDRVRKLPIELLSVPDRLIDSAVDLKSKYPISFADAFAVAQAVELSCALITGDRDLLRLQEDGVVGLHWLGK